MPLWNHTWTDAEDKLIVEWGKVGFSTREIAIKLQSHGVKVTKNSIIGRWHRLKFKSATKPGWPKSRSVNEKPSKPRSTIRDRKASIPAPSVLPDEPMPNCPSIALITATEASCRYPIGPAKAMRCCGALNRLGSFYCDNHHRVVYAPKVNR